MRSSSLNCSTHIKPQATQRKDTPRGDPEGERASITYGIPGIDYEQWINDKCKFSEPERSGSTRLNMGCFRQVEQCTEPMLNIAPGEPEKEQDIESYHKAPNPLLLHLAIGQYGLLHTNSKNGNSLTKMLILLLKWNQRGRVDSAIPSIEHYDCQHWRWEIYHKRNKS